MNIIREKRSIEESSISIFPYEKFALYIDVS